MVASNLFFMKLAENECNCIFKQIVCCLYLYAIYTTQNLLRITFSFNDLMLKTNRLKKDFFL